MNVVLGVLFYFVFIFYECLVIIFDVIEWAEMKAFQRMTVKLQNKFYHNNYNLHASYCI